MDAAQVGEWALSIGLLAGIGVTAVQAVVDEERRAKLRVLTRLRARRAERAAVAASIDDPLFAPETIRASVQEMLATAESIWRGANGSEGKRRRNDLIAAWAEDRHRRIGAGLRLLGKPQIDVLRVVNRESESEDRAIVRVRLRIHRDPKAVREPERRRNHPGPANRDRRGALDARPAGRSVGARVGERRSDFRRLGVRADNHFAGRGRRARP